ncbi:MAG: divalent-cation tolerance protein CutA, partial [Patescibacteria group bacterium]
MILVYITNPDKKTALKVARHLLAKKLIACGNIFPAESLYMWQSKKTQAKEFVLLAKTIDKHFTAIQKEVAKIHPYKIPCVIKIASKANSAFLTWLKGEVV